MNFTENGWSLFQENHKKLKSNPVSKVLLAIDCDKTLFLGNVEIPRRK